MYSLPVNVLWVSKCKYIHEILNNHVHDCFHLFYVKKGKGRMIVNGVEQPLKENMIYFFPPGIVHGFFPDESSPAYTIEVKFIALDDKFRKKLKTLEYVIGNCTANFCMKLEELVLEALYKPLLYQDIINADFLRLLLEMIRNSDRAALDKPYLPEEMKESSLCNKGDMKNVIEYINSNFSRHITLQDLASIGMMSSTCLCKLFNNFFKASPMQYVNNVRLSKARELLMYSDFNITQISEMTGFKSVHYFSRYFKKKENMTPVDFKSSVHENVRILLDDDFKIRCINCDAG